MLLLKHWVLLEIQYANLGVWITQVHEIMIKNNWKKLLIQFY